MTTAHNKENTDLVRDIIRHPYAWPGGYERAALCNDGALLCHKCLKDEYRNIIHSTRFRYADGWEITGQVILYCADDIDEHCAHCDNPFFEEE